MNKRIYLALALSALTFTLLLAQSALQKKSYAPDAATQARIREKMDLLHKKLQQVEERLKQLGLQNSPAGLTILADISIYHKAARWITEHQEWYRPEYPQWTLEILDRGIRRADDYLQHGKPTWLLAGGPVALGYFSDVDRSVQPYIVVLPRGFGAKQQTQHRLDVILHGRDATLNEVKFLYSYPTTKPGEERDYIELHVYGRGNNAYRWAGESDVLEAVHDWAARFPQVFDPDRVVLRGFSMGGAGAWHLGLHYPHLWCSVSPGAGFTTTHGYVKGLPQPLPPYQEACLKIYDAVEYAENAYNVPIVAYGGELDPQLQAAKNIAARLQPLKIPMTLIIGPKTEHRYHPESLRTILQLQAKHAQAGRARYPERVRFVTYHPQYATAHWIHVVPENLYQASRVDAHWDGNRYVVQTDNLWAIRITLPSDHTAATVNCQIDGQSVEAAVDVVNDTGDWRPRRIRAVTLWKRNGQWQAVPWAQLSYFQVRQMRKTGSAAGPIDQAFRSRFVCVVGTGQPWNRRVEEYAQAELKRFQREWSKYMRGDLPLVRDVEVTSEVLARHHVVLFGDPGSNRILAGILDQLPLTWDKTSLRFAGHTYPARDHVPVLCYASPFAAGRLVVINSGHTFHAADFEGTNALLFPRLGDYALLRLSAGDNPLACEVVRAGLFDSNWKLTGSE
jgi:dienelactone hydrolase